MGAHSSQARSTGRPHGRGRHRARQQRLEPYNWLGAGAITVTVALGSAFVGGSGIAHADEDSGKPAATASSNASESTTSGTEVHTPKPTHRKKPGAATPPKVADPASSESTSSTGKASDTETPTTPAADKGDQSQTDAETTGAETKSPETTSAPEGSDPSKGTTTTAVDKPDVDASDVQEVADTAAVSTPDPVDTPETSTPLALNAFDVSENKSSSTARQLSAASLAAPSVAAIPNPLALIGAVISYDLKGAQHLMNPVIAGALGVWHLQTGINELKTLHLIGGALDIISGVLALATPILKAVPVPGVSLLIPVTAVLGSTTATINTIGQGLLHW
ncbi:MAG TPA: hypothetical protein VL634_08880 [Mycobacterium sp.]|jgi:hypothetical protein|nr:hypothetical protein [Mycobacterium sp.]